MEDTQQPSVHKLSEHEEQPTADDSSRLIQEKKDLMGLDFYLRQYNKLFICDILKMEEKFKGVYFYNGHPMYKVDIQGIIVKVTQNRKCFMYTVDDSTAIIICCVWKNVNYRNKQSLDLDDLPDILRKKACLLNTTVVEDDIGYQLGDMINVRGKMTEFRDNREIMVNQHFSVDNQELEIFRLAHLPKLYKDNYDKPFVLTEKVKLELANKNCKQVNKHVTKDMIVSQTQNIIEAHVQLNGLTEMTLKDICDIEDCKLLACQNNNELVGCVEEALSIMEKLGIVVSRLEKCPVYEFVNSPNKTAVEVVILSILTKAKENKRFHELGCHSYHVLGELHNTKQYVKMNKLSVNKCLSKLEQNSDIISTSYSHFMLCGV